MEDSQNIDLSEMAAMVQQRAEELLPDSEGKAVLEPRFIKACLDANERGDGVLYASLNRGKFIYNTTPRDGEWYVWLKHVWERDDFKQSFAAVEAVALEYLKAAADLDQQIRDEGIKNNKAPGGWKIDLKKEYIARAARLRSHNGANKALVWAPVVAPWMACREDQFDLHPWFLPCRNGVIDLRTGALIDGRPEYMLTRFLDIDYDPHADYQPVIEFLDDVCVDENVPGSEEIPQFLKRVFGYAATGFSHEQYLFVFVGPGRNGKGVLFNAIGDIMGPFYHEIPRGMLIEQRNEPSPAAASEHLYSLFGKRIIVGAETNKGQKVDSSALKGLTGEDKITCRPLFGSQINFMPSHTMFLHTNHLLHGLTKDFAMVQRLLKIEFPHMYVDDVEAESRRYPAQAARFRKKDPDLKKKMRSCRQGWLRWIVEGCLEWQQIGLRPPDCIIKGVHDLESEEDAIGEFVKDCLNPLPPPRAGEEQHRMPCTALYDAFKWWWSVNMDPRDQRVPALKTLTRSMRERGYKIEKAGGKTWLYGQQISYEVVNDINDFISSGGKS